VWIAARNPVGETTSELSIFNNSETDRRPRTLFAVLVGVDHYPNLGGTCPLSNGCDLQFAGNDAIEFEKALRTKVRPRYRSYKPFLFYNANVQNANASQPDSTDEPTSPKIMEALKTLALAGSEDTIVMFFSGHGTKDRNGEYLLLTSDSQRDINQGTYSNDLPWSKVFKAIKGASGRKLIFLDSCKSGSSFNAEVAKTPDEHIDTYTSTDKPRPSREYPSLSHGAFTAAILRGLRDGKAAIPPSTEVDTWTLGSFLKREVKDLSGGVQTPGLWLANPALVLGD
jgi:uncharacterized caspase-like protein